MTEPRIITDLSEAASLLEFENVVVYEARGQRRDGGFEDLIEDTTNAEGKGQLRMDLLVQDGNEGLAIRAQCVTGSADAVVTYDAAVVYRKAEPMSMDTATTTAFITSVGLMTLYPFLREGVHQVSTRLGVTPIRLGLLRAGQADVQLQTSEPGSDHVDEVLVISE